MNKNVIGYAVRSVEAAKHFLENNNPNSRDKYGRTPLHSLGLYPIDILEIPKIIQLFIDDGADPNAQDMNGSTPLHCCLFRHNTDVIMESLLDNGADPFIKDNRGLNPLNFLLSRFSNEMGILTFKI